MFSISIWILYRKQTYHWPTYHHGCQFGWYLETILTGRKNLNDLWCFQRVSQKQKYGQPVPISCKIFTFRGWTNLNLGFWKVATLYYVKTSKDQAESWHQKFKQNHEKLCCSIKLSIFADFLSMHRQSSKIEVHLSLHDMLPSIQKSKKFSQR